MYSRFFSKKLAAFFSPLKRYSHTHSYPPLTAPPQKEYLLDTIYIASCIDDAFRQLSKSPTPHCYRCQHLSVIIKFDNHIDKVYNVSCKLHNMHPSKSRLDFSKCGPEGRHYTPVK